MIMAGRLAVDDPLIDAQVAGAARRPVGQDGAFRFARNASLGPIDAVMAMAFAAHSAAYSAAEPTLYVPKRLVIGCKVTVPMGRIRDFLLGKPTRYEATRTYIGFGLPDAGLVGSGVTATTALGLSSVWRCLDILCNGVSQLDWDERRRNLELPPSRLVSQPQADCTRREWRQLVVSTLALYDVCYLLKVGGEDTEGVPIGARLTSIRASSCRCRTDTYSVLPPTEFWRRAEPVRRDQLVILHRSPQPGVSDDLGGVIRLARITFAAAIAAEGYASRYWQAGGQPHDDHSNRTSRSPTPWPRA